MQYFKPSLFDLSLALDRTSTIALATRSFFYNNIQKLAARTTDLLTPKIVEIEVSIDRQLSDAIALAIRDLDFRQQLIAHPQPTLASLDIYLPECQSVTVLESTADRIFLVLPIESDLEIEYLRSEVNSRKPQRAIRARIILNAWQDPDYKARLITEPNRVLSAEGFNLPANTIVKVLENSLDRLFLVIPTVS